MSRARESLTSISLTTQLLWTVNIGLRRKLTLMGLFSGVAFVIMASIIRAVTILTVRSYASRTDRLC